MARRSPRAVGGAGAASSGATPTGKRGRGTFDNPVEFASEGSHDGDDEPRDMLNGDGDADGDADGDDDGEWGLPGPGVAQALCSTPVTASGRGCSGGGADQQGGSTGAIECGQYIRGR